MAIVITVDSVDITGNIPLMGNPEEGLPPLVVESRGAGGITSVASFGVSDGPGSVSIAVKDTVTIVDGGTTFFGGEVATIESTEVGGVILSRVIQCQDNNILLDETVITIESFAQGATDSTTIDSLFTTYRSDIDSTTHVSTVDASMEAIDFVGKTLREAMTEICERTGAFFYVDGSKLLHYFAAESNAAAFNLSDSPDLVTTFPYGNLRRSDDGTVIIDEVLVIGTEIADVVGSGVREAVIWDHNIVTSQAATDRGNALIARYGSALITYSLDMWEDGLVAGMDIDITNGTLSLTAVTVTIRRMSMTPRSVDGAERVYSLELGDVVLDSASSARTVDDRLSTVQEGIDGISDVVLDTDAPAASTFVAGNITTGVNEDADGHQSAWIRATWGSVADSDLHHYEIQLADNTAFNWPQIYEVLTEGGGEDREVEWIDLLGNTTYYLRVRTVDWTGNFSVWSPQPTGYLSKVSSSDTAAPAQVANLSAASARTIVGLSWDKNTEADLKHYEIQRADDAAGSPGAWGDIAVADLNFFVDEDFTDAEIAAADTFWYRVRAVDTSTNAGTYATQTSVALGQIKNDHIAVGTLTANRIGANEITAAQIAANTITAAEIVASTITATEITGSTLSAIYADMGLLTAGEIRVGTGTVGSNFTGFRIYGDNIAGFTNDVLQVGISKSGGTFTWAAGNGVLDADGIRVEASNAASAADINSLLFTRSSTNDVALVGAYYQAGFNALSLQAFSSATRTSAINISALGGSSDSEIKLTSGAADNFPAIIEMDYDDSDSSSRIDIWTTGILRARFDKAGAFHINDTTNGKMTLGITINQGANDDEAFALKSSDVAHGAVNLTETDSFGIMTKAAGAAGGLQISGYRDADGDNSGGLILQGNLAEDVNTDKTTAARALVEIFGRQTSGAAAANTVADGNVCAFRTRRGGSTVAVAFIDEDGDFYYDGALNNYDDEDDPVAVWDLAHFLSGNWNQMLEYNREKFEDLRIIAVGDDERPMISIKRMTALMMGAIGQLYQKTQRYEKALLGLGIEPEMLEA